MYVSKLPSKLCMKNWKKEAKLLKSGKLRPEEYRVLDHTWVGEGFPLNSRALKA